MPAEAAEPVEMPAKPAEPVEPVEDKNEDESAHWMRARRARRGRPHCLKLLCAQYKWIQVEEAKDFLGFGSEASVSDAEVLRAADMFNGELKSIFGDLEEAWRRLFRVLKPCKCCGGGYGRCPPPPYLWYMRVRWRLLSTALTSVLSGCWQP